MDHAPGIGVVVEVVELAGADDQVGVMTREPGAEGRDLSRYLVVNFALLMLALTLVNAGTGLMTWIMQDDGAGIGRLMARILGFVLVGLQLSPLVVPSAVLAAWIFWRFPSGMRRRAARALTGALIFSGVLATVSLLVGGALERPLATDWGLLARGIATYGVALGSLWGGLSTQPAARGSTPTSAVGF